MIKELRQLVGGYGRLFGAHRDALLLPLQTEVTARHLLPLARLAREQDIAVNYALSPNIRDHASRQRIRDAFDELAREVGSTEAHRQRWTLVVVADHGHFHTLRWNSSPMAHIGHGSPSKLGGRIAHLPWEYGQAPRRRNGALVYREMIEASERVRDALIDIEPALAGRIRVLGRLLDDEMLESAADKAGCLNALGLAADRPVLMVASTVKAQSLFAMYWDVLLDRLRALVDRYQVVLCPHPNEYERWKTRLGDDSDFRLLRADQAAETVLAVARVLLTDCSSLCQKAALLDVPMVFARCDPLPVWPQGATARLYASWPQWDGTAALDGLLEQALSLRGEATAQDVRDWVNSHPGQARELFRQWLAGYFPATNGLAHTGNRDGGTGGG